MLPSYIVQVTLVSLLLAACSQSETGAQAATNDAISKEANETAPENLATVKIGNALFEQIKCIRPPEASIAVSSMLKNHLIARTNDGGDGIGVFVPIKAMKLLGFDVVRLAGWDSEPDAEGGNPFSRGPGTAPPNHISITLKASASDVRHRLSNLGIAEGYYTEDNSQEAWIDSNGQSHLPQRFVPGPVVREGDYDGYIQHPLSGVTTITCSANEDDFKKESQAQFDR